MVVGQNSRQVASMAGSYKDLRVWKQSMELAELVYQTTAEFPRHEL